MNHPVVVAYTVRQRKLSEERVGWFISKIDFLDVSQQHSASFQTTLADYHPDTSPASQFFEYLRRRYDYLWSLNSDKNVSWVIERPGRFFALAASELLLTSVTFPGRLLISPVVGVDELVCRLFETRKPDWKLLVDTLGLDLGEIGEQLSLQQKLAVFTEFACRIGLIGGDA